MEEKASTLEEEERTALMAMANEFPEIPSAVAGIFMTNSFDMTDSPHGTAAGMYCAIARLNHSCNPNAQQTHIPETGEEYLIATRTIEVGDEINDCYIELRQTKSDRQNLLQELYRFQCGCRVCSLPSNSSSSSSSRDDKARSRAMQLDSSIIDAAETDADTALAVVQQYLSLLKVWCSDAAATCTDEELACCMGWSDRYMGGAYLYAFQIANALGKQKQANAYLLEAHKWNSVLQGDKAPDTQNTLSLLKSRKIKL